ncbi:CrcB protein [Mesorhizobium soli]|uniref:fluoride efflux transporter CrcB n=1 Tax=Pseudaminobacter soli (ex Li et al. 2025) TaxID=1295366 RepID=UPI002476748C|nr:fluoride efflux transporter CrcB [Mesorhizobium soli]MDH6232073.1 CrcB protein [Mesorhizobium soli]
MNRPEPTHAAAPPRAQAWIQNFRDRASLYLAVSLGAVIGSVLRALVSLTSLAMFGPGFPWGTLFVNIVGSFVIGFYSTLTGPDGRLLVGSRNRQFVMAGICGGFTTFSTFSLETLRLTQSGHWSLAGLNVIISVIAWLLAVWLGHLLAMRLNRLGGI